MRVGRQCQWPRLLRAYLTSLNLRGCLLITNVAVVAVASECHQLAMLDLGGCFKITDAAGWEWPQGRAPQAHIVEASLCQEGTDTVSGMIGSEMVFLCTILILTI